MCAVTNRKRNGQKSRQRSSLLFGGRNSFNSMPHYRFSTRMIWRNRRTDVWYTGWFRKMDDHLVHTKPIQQPDKMDVLSKTFLQIRIPCCYIIGKCGIQVRFPNSRDDLCLLFRLCLLLWPHLRIGGGWHCPARPSAAPWGRWPRLWCCTGSSTIPAPDTGTLQVCIN